MSNDNTAKPTAGQLYGVKMLDSWTRKTKTQIFRKGGKYAFVAEFHNDADAELTIQAFNVHHETGLTPRQLVEQRDELLAALKSLASFTDGNICRHETTHRGGHIWEICDDCGARWADDQGGKPDACDPASLTAARAIIAKVEAKP